MSLLTSLQLAGDQTTHCPTRHGARRLLRRQGTDLAVHSSQQALHMRVTHTLHACAASAARAHRLLLAVDDGRSDCESDGGCGKLSGARVS